MATSTKKVLVAMSGGVDSSVAATLLKEQGYDLIGATMNLSCTTNSSDRGCCSASAAADAKKVADMLGFPHYVLNFKDEFQKYVIDNFVEEYKNGRTPNPCVRCNQYLKFDFLHKKSRGLGCDHVATGHYARIMSNDQLPINTNEGVPSARYKLLKGRDNNKDQSYVLYMTNQESLAHSLFPLGDLTKQQVREIARKYGLPVAEKEESQEICFVADDDYGRFLREVVPEAVKPGPILDRQGNIIGTHGGIAFYTIGQRKGVGAHRGNPKYVVEIDRGNNLIIVGDSEDTFADELIARDVLFVSGSLPVGPLEVSAKIRYNSTEAKAVIRSMGGKVDGSLGVKFEKPQRAITPGQSVVFYNGDEVLGGGLIGR